MISEISGMKANVKMAVFWVVAPCSLVEVYRRLLSYYLNHQGDHRPVMDLKI
jgi:hypothetical protein